MDKKPGRAEMIAITISVVLGVVILVTSIYLSLPARPGHVVF